MYLQIAGILLHIQTLDSLTHIPLTGPITSVFKICCICLKTVQDHSAIVKPYTFDFPTGACM